MIRRLLAFTPLLLVGCAGGDGKYPSLALRPVETRGFAEPAAPAATAAIPDPKLDAELARLNGDLERITAGFAAASGDAERKAGRARGRPAGSDPWLEAQTALAGLDDWRAQVSAVSTDVEQLAIARAATLAVPYPALTALGERADAEAEGQGRTIARLQAMLAPA